MRRLGAALLIILMALSLSQGTQRVDVAGASETYQWVSVNNGLFDGTIDCFAIDPADTDVIYVATNGDVFRSPDAGASWSRQGSIDTKKGHNYIYCLTVMPTSRLSIYAATNGGVFKSVDAGAEWTVAGLKGYDIRSLVVDPSNAQTMYAKGDAGIGLFKSTDGGTTWAQLGQKSGELDVGLSGELVYAMAVDPRDSSILYAGASEESVFSRGMLFKSTDGGQKWTTSDTGLKCDRVTAIAVDPSDTNIIYAGTRVDGVFKTMDGGRSWVKSSAGLSGTGTWVSSLVTGRRSTGVLYAVTSGGVFKSADAAGSWSAVNTGLPYYATTQGRCYVDVVSVAIDPASSVVMYAGVTGNGVYKTVDGGKNWTRTNKGLVQASSGVFCLAMDPGNTQVIYAGVDSGNVFKSIDGGANWEKINRESPQYSFIHLAIDPSNTGTIYAITGNSASDQSNVFKSIDGGAGWSQVGLTTIDATSLVIDPGDPRVVYVGTTAAVFKSTDGGAAWTKTGLENPRGFSVTSLVLDPTHTKTVYAGTSGLNSGGSIVKSTDGGVSWIQSVTTSTSVESLVIDPKDARTIYAGTSGGSVIKSTDSGTNWVQVTDGSTKIVGSTLTVDPSNTQILYAAVSLNGVAKSVDAGRTWSDMNAGLANGHYYNQVHSLVIDPTDAQEIYAGTQYGVFKTVQVKSCTIVATASPGGSISPSGAIAVNSGESKTFTVKPDSNYKISLLKVDGVPEGSMSSYTFTNIATNHTIEAVFEKVVLPPSQTVIVLRTGKSTFTVNGASKALDSPPVIKNGRTLVPIRAIIEALGGTVDWDGTTRKATVTLGDTPLELWIGKSSATVNGITMPIDSSNAKVVPEIINGRTMLPLRFVSENLGATVGWDQSTQTITITYQP